MIDVTKVKVRYSHQVAQKGTIEQLRRAVRRFDYCCFRMGMQARPGKTSMAWMRAWQEGVRKYSYLVEQLGYTWEEVNELWPNRFFMCR